MTLCLQQCPHPTTRVMKKKSSLRAIVMMKIQRQQEEKTSSITTNNNNSNHNNSCNISRSSLRWCKIIITKPRWWSCSILKHRISSWTNKTHHNNKIKGKLLTRWSKVIGSRDPARWTSVRKAAQSPITRWTLLTLAKPKRTAQEWSLQETQLAIEEPLVIVTPISLNNRCSSWQQEMSLIIFASGSLSCSRMVAPRTCCYQKVTKGSSRTAQTLQTEWWHWTRFRLWNVGKSSWMPGVKLKGKLLISTISRRKAVV